MHRLAQSLPAPAVLALAALVALWLDWQWPIAWSRSLPELGFGMVLILLALILLGWTLLLMRRHKTTLNPYQRARRLLVKGPFAFSRNPIYLGLLLFCAGVGVLWGNAWVCAGLPLVMLALQQGIIRYEEQRLAQQFGEEYSHYCRNVRRWL